jgi:hypothetical protein
MKNITLYFLGTLVCLLLMVSCEKEREISSINPANWKKRTTSLPAVDSLVEGTSYLSVYSQIYSMTEHLSFDLAATVSMRNVNRSDTIYLKHAEYYDTHGKLIRTYFDRPIFIAPLETIEIIIDRTDKAGGSGANFLFDWTTKPGVHEPFFEAVMISTAGSMGISFVTEGRKVE